MIARHDNSMGYPSRTRWHRLLCREACLWRPATRACAGLALAAAAMLGWGSAALADQPRAERAAAAQMAVQTASIHRCDRCGMFHGQVFDCPCAPPKYFAPGQADTETCPDLEAAAPAAPTPEGVPTPEPIPQNELAPQRFDDVASSFGATASAQSAAPFMIGDSFGGGGQLTYFNNYERLTQVNVPGGGGGGPMKIADNSSPLPRCRAFVNYNFFSHAVGTVSTGLGSTPALDVNRYTFGWEQCFAEGRFSVEVRVPFASTIDSQQFINQPAVLGTQFGHVTTTFKALLLERENWALTGGLSLNAPTSNNFLLQGSSIFSNLRTIAQINDQSIHLLPYLGYLATPSDRWFVQGFVQADFDTRGNDVLLNQGTGLRTVGTVQDQSLLYLDASIGYWLYRDASKSRGITGIAPLLELHYTTTMQNADILNYPNSSLPLFGNLYNRFDVLNMTGGLTITLGQRSYITLAGVAPLKNFPDRFFNGEAAVLYNYFF